MPTIRGNRTQLAALLIAAIAGGAVYAQFSERIEVRLHQLDVIVETRDGKPVTDLTKDDFIVTRDKKQQEITNFSVFVDPAVASQGNPTAAAEPPRERRKFIFFIDQVAMYPPTRDVFLTRVNEILGAMNNGDQGMVVTPASIEEKIPLYLTSDKNLLMRTLVRVTRAMMVRLDTTPLKDPWEPSFGGFKVDVGPVEVESIKRIDDCGQSLEVCSQKRLKSLKSIIKTAERLPGKKVLVLMTTRMSSAPGLVLNKDTAMPHAGHLAVAGEADRRQGIPRFG
jgi:VWFA-related protein